MYEKRISILPPPGINRIDSNARSSVGVWYDSNWVRWNGKVLEPRQGLTQWTGIVISLGMPVRFVGEVTDLSLYSYMLNVGGSGSYEVFVNGTLISQSPPKSIGYWYSRPVRFGSVWLFMDPNGTTYSGVMYAWNPATQFSPSITAATVVTGAPSGTGVVVTPERFAVVLGAQNNVRQIYWSDQEDYTYWTIDATHQAGNLILATDGMVITGLAGKYQTYIWSDRELFIMSYVGGSAVYSVAKAGDNCGIAGPNAFAQVGDRIFWINASGQAFMYSGTVVPLDMRPVQDLIETLFTGSRMISWHSNAWGDVRYNEVNFSIGVFGSDPSLTLTYNYQDNTWSVTHYGFTGAQGISTFGGNYTPLYGASDGKIYWEQVARTTGGSTLVGASYAETSLISDDGSRRISIQKIIPQMNALSKVAITWYYSDQLTATESSSGPTTLASDEQDARLNGRYFRYKLTDTGTPSDWRVTDLKVGMVALGNR